MDEKIVNPIIQKCREALEKYYGQRLKGVILYGSIARGEAGPASDIDLLVLLFLHPSIISPNCVSSWICAIPPG